MTVATRIERKEVVDMMKSLIGIKSINPAMEGGNGEAEISRFVANFLESIGVEVHIQDVTHDRFNVIGILRGDGSGRSLMLNGHTDTVGVKGMTIDPFKAEMGNDNIHGRGACDMKGALAAMMIAMKALAQSEAKLSGDLLFCAVVDEESGSIGTEKLIQQYRSDAAIIGEPTELQIATAHDGFVWLEIETHGKAVHGSVPEKGVDAIANMAKIITSLEGLRSKFAEKKHHLVGVPKIHTSKIEGGSDCWGMTPEFCRLRIERQTVPGETSKEVVNEIHEIVRGLVKDQFLFEAKVEKVFERPSMEIAIDERIVKILEVAVKRVRGTTPRIIGKPYWTDGAILVNNASIPTCLLGPGDITLAHSANEYVKISEVVDCAKIYALAASSFCAS